MADLHIFQPHVKLPASELNGNFGELAARAAAASTAAAQGLAAASVADSDALAARAAAGAADTKAVAAGQAAASAQATADAAKVAAQGAQATADAATTSAAAAKAKADTVAAGLAANVTATTAAQGRADAAYALAQSGSGGGAVVAKRPPLSEFVSFGLVPGQITSDTEGGALTVYGVPNAVQCPEGYKTALPGIPCYARCHVKAYFSKGNVFSSGIMIGTMNDTAMLSFAYQRGEGLVVNQWANAAQFAGNLANVKTEVLLEDSWFQVVVDRDHVTFGYGRDNADDYVRIAQYPATVAGFTPNAVGLFGNFYDPNPNDPHSGFVSLAAMKRVSGLPVIY